VTESLVEETEDDNDHGDCLPLLAGTEIYLAIDKEGIVLRYDEDLEDWKRDDAVKAIVKALAK
jgi:hypothetical protein